MKSILSIPLGSIVIFENTKYFVEKAKIENGFLEYSLLGHKDLDSEGDGITWVDHDELEFVSYPTEDTLKKLLEVIDNDEYEKEYEVWEFGNYKD